MGRKTKSAVWGSALVAIIQAGVGVAIACGVDAQLAQSLGHTLSIVVGALFGANIVMTGAEDAAHKLGSPWPPEGPAIREPATSTPNAGTVRRNPPADPSGVAGGVIRSMVLVAILIPSALALPACNQPEDRIVERHLQDVVADLKYRGAWERGQTRSQFETYRTQKHQQLEQAHEQALKFLETTGKLTTEAAKRAADRFGALHHELDSRVDLAISIALRACEWFDLAAHTITSAVDYYQAKDRAWTEFGRGALEGFTKSFAATRRDPSDEMEQKAQGLMDQVQTDLLSMLNARLGPPGSSLR